MQRFHPFCYAIEVAIVNSTVIPLKSDTLTLTTAAKRIEIKIKNKNNNNKKDEKGQARGLLPPSKQAEKWR